MSEPAKSYELVLYEKAVEYIRMGFYVVPLMKNRKTLPPKESGINYQSASRNMKTIKRWFHPNDGKFAGWNIGIACGMEDGVFAIDLDRHGEEDGIRNFENLVAASGEQLPDCPIQITPNGGKHLLFKWQTNCRSGSNTLSKAVDTRGGNFDTCKSHIVAYPSIVDDKHYRWERETLPPAVPQWIMDLLGDSRQWDEAKNRGNELVTEDDLEEILDEQQIRNMLRYINPDDCDYDRWLRVGLAIKSQYPDQKGLEIWDEWSKSGQRYKNGECDVRWDGFSDFGTVRAGSLFYFSREGGWNPEPGEKKGNKYDALVAEMNETYAVITVGGKIRILRERGIATEMDMHYDLLDKDGFKTLLENQKIPVTINGKTKNVPITSVWLAHEGRRTFRNGIGLFPDGAVPDGYFNTWHGFTVQPRKGSCQKFLDHIRHVICDDDDSLTEWVLDWIGDLFQDPANPKGCAIVMRGDEGAGKGVLANAIGSIFGPHHRHLIDDTHLTSNFNAHLLDAITVFADEITWGGNKRTAGKLKGMVTETHLVGERKGIDAILYRNMVHLFVASNSEWVIPAGPQSRRWCVLNVSNERCKDRKYFNGLFKEIENGGREAILYYFLNRPIRSDLRRAPETDGLLDQRMLNMQDDTVFQWWRKALISGNLGAYDIRDAEKEWPEQVDKVELYHSYEQHILSRSSRPVVENMFAKRIARYGIGQSRPKIGNRRRRVYEIPSIEKGTDKLNEMIPGAIADETKSNSSIRKGRGKRKQIDV